MKVQTEDCNLASADADSIQTERLISIRAKMVTISVPMFWVIPKVIMYRQQKHWTKSRLFVVQHLCNTVRSLADWSTLNSNRLLRNPSALYFETRSVLTACIQILRV